jgi:hypothetical protein
MAEPITAHNLRVIGGGNGIIAIADLQVTGWGVTLLRCRWRRENGHDRLGLPCDGISFRNAADAWHFQLAALAAMRAALAKMLEASAP